MYVLLCVWTYVLYYNRSVKETPLRISACAWMVVYDNIRTSRRVVRITERDKSCLINRAMFQNEITKQTYFKSLGAVTTFLSLTRHSRYITRVSVSTNSAAVAYGAKTQLFGRIRKTPSTRPPVCSQVRCGRSGGGLPGGQTVTESFTCI